MQENQNEYQNENQNKIENETQGEIQDVGQNIYIDVEAKRKRFYKQKSFWIGFGATVLPFLIAFLLTNSLRDYSAILVLVGSIPYAIVGFILWTIFWSTKRALALGILLGSLLPFLTIFIMTGGCGIFYI